MDDNIQKLSNQRDFLYFTTCIVRLALFLLKSQFEVMCHFSVHAEQRFLQFLHFNGPFEYMMFTIISSSHWAFLLRMNLFVGNLKSESYYSSKGLQP